MMFKYLNTTTKEWENPDDLFVHSILGVCELEHRLFGKAKVKPRTDIKYYNSTNLLDRNKVMVYNGDILSDEEDLYEMFYSVSHGSYFLLKYSDHTGENISEEIVGDMIVVGHVDVNGEILIEEMKGVDENE